jgi:acetyl-CoA synthetase
MSSSNTAHGPAQDATHDAAHATAAASPAAEAGLSLFPVPPAFAAQARYTRTQYEQAYARCLREPEAFWRETAARLDWFVPPTRIKDVSYRLEDFRIRWFDDGELNASVNCLDRHLAERGDKTALIFEPDDPNAAPQRISYRQLHARVCQLANALRHLGVGKGDRITIYLPMIPEAVVAMLACARIGAVHSVVFGGFSPHSIADRIADCASKLVITADEGLRGGKTIPLKENVNAALKMPGTDSVETVLVVRHTGGAVGMQMPRDRWYSAVVDRQDTACEPARMNAEDPLFILYTSGSTGKPKGVLHTTGGYLVWASYTHEAVFDLREDDIYWCTADVGWVTGHSYIVYGPLANGATSLVFEGVPSYPNASRFWQVIDRHRVTLFYTAPTAIRALMREGEAPVKATSRASLRLLGSVGEPINPEAWRWYHSVVGDGRCPIVDTWWQTETGGILIAPLPGATDLKPGSATIPFFGVQPALVDANGVVLDGAAEGNLVLLDSWPGQMRTVYGDHPRFIETYFKTYPGMYFTGDGCRRDADGYYWITGRVDDVINVSGHRIGTAEVESALVSHPKVAEAAVVGFPHDIKGQGIYAYVTLIAGESSSEALRKELVAHVRKEIGPIATPDCIQWAPGLPKTRSGKIMRRILRKIAEAGSSDLAPEQLGDTSTLADPSVVQSLVRERLVS